MILGKRVRLRALERDDLSTVVRWINDPATRATLATWRPMSMADEQRWFDWLSVSQTDMVFIIELAPVAGEEGLPRAIGMCGLHKLEWKNRAGSVGIVIGKESDRGKGHGTDALRTLTKWAHDELGLVRVELEVFPHNTAGVRSYEKIGYRVDGKRRSAYFRDGKFHDMLLMSCLPGELTKE